MSLGTEIQCPGCHTTFGVVFKSPRRNKNTVENHECPVCESVLCLVFSVADTLGLSDQVRVKGKVEKPGAPLLRMEAEEAIERIQKEQSCQKS